MRKIEITFIVLISIISFSVIGGTSIPKRNLIPAKDIGEVLSNASYSNEYIDLDDGKIYECEQDCL